MCYSFTSMCRPLHGIQVHALFVHLPQGREFAQLADLGAQELDRVVDLLLGGDAADRKTNRAVGELVRTSQGPQDVRGLEARRSAGRARGYRHVLDPHDQRLAFDEVEADVEVSGNAPLHVAVDVDLFHVLEACEQPVAQGADAFALGAHLEPGNAERLAHADDLVGRERSRAQPPLVAAAVDLRLDAHPWLASHVKRAYAFRAVHLVRGHRQEVHFQLLQVDRDLSGGLHRVAVEDDALRAADLADLRDRLDHADLVVHHHHRDEDGIGAQRRLELLQVEQAVLPRIEIGRFEALALELAHGIEHRLVLGLHRDDMLERQGFEATYLDPRQDGLLDLEKFKAALRPDTVLVSVMMVNNEIGVIQPIAEIGEICRSKGIIFHCDAVQAAGKIPVDLQKLKVDLLTVTAHKVYGPKGIGALYVRRKPRVRIEAQIHGGGHERGLRSGTLPTHQIVGMGEAFRIAKLEMAAESERIRSLRDRLLAGFKDMEEVYVNGNLEHRIPGNLNISFNFVEGESLIMGIKDVAVSSGSACTSASLEPSYVLRALGRSDELAHSSIRFTIGRFTTEEEIDYAIKLLRAKIGKLRELSPLWEMYKEGVDLNTVQWAAH